MRILFIGIVLFLLSIFSVSSASEVSSFGIAGGIAVAFALSSFSSCSVFSSGDVEEKPRLSIEGGVAPEIAIKERAPQKSAPLDSMSVDLDESAFEIIPEKKK